MLKKFDYLRGVGSFEDYCFEEGQQFGAVTLIYGENGTGKSTLAATVDALREGNNTEVLRRRSLAATDTPRVGITLAEVAYTFEATGWSGQPPHDTIDVFFPGFVTRNVHAATAIDSDHRRHLCELVLGRSAVEMVVGLAKADDDARTALTDLKNVEKQLQLIIKPPDTIETFAAINPDPSIDQKIAQIDIELSQARRKDLFLKRSVPNVVPLPTLDSESLVALLGATVAAANAEASSQVLAHIRQCLDDRGENWLEYGSRHISVENNCPFCAQSLEHSMLAAATRVFFSAEYQSYVDDTTQRAEDIRASTGPQVLNSAHTAFIEQQGCAASWSEEIPFDREAFTESINQARTAWMKGVELLELILTSKLRAIGDPVEQERVAPVIEAFSRAASHFDALNSKLADARVGVIALRTSLAASSVAGIEEKLRKLQNQKRRFEPDAQQLLNKRRELGLARTKREADKVRLKKEIDDHAARVVGKYKDGINHYLEHFGCDARITQIEPRFPSGKASVQYVLEARGHEIELGTSLDKPCFETVLSEGDKYTLALSFFLARLKQIDKLDGRTIVLDDPVNSLGRSRRTLIAGVIRNLRSRGAQVIVLTHDERLAALMWRDKMLKGLVPLQVERTGKGSKIRAWDIEQAMRSEYVTNFLTLQSFLDHGGDHEGAAKCIRPYVEQRLRYLYPGPPFTTQDSLGCMISKIRDSKTGSHLFFLQKTLTELEAINGASLPSHHGAEDDAGMEPLTAEGVRLFAEKALTVLA